MNAGIQDAWNLGWKLALAERGAATEVLLDSYDAERRDLGVRVTQDGAPVPRLLTVDDALTRRARDVVRPFLASIPGYERHVGGRIARRSSGYRSSPAVEQRGPAQAKVAPGDLAPDAPFTSDAGVRIRDGRSYVSLLFTGDMTRSDPRGPVDIPRPARLPIRSVLVTREPGLRAPRSGTSVVVDSGGHIHHAWDITRPTHVLVRPDGHIGWRSEPPDVAAFNRYLARLHGTTPPDQPSVSGAARPERLAG
jgi:hypothetical protein